MRFDKEMPQKQKNYFINRIKSRYFRRIPEITAFFMQMS